MRILWLALLGSVILAEEQYFPQSSAKTWDEARDHCQTCFKDLATITCRNTHLILQNLNSEYWIGLRRRFNGSKAWSRWSNGDRVTYQNWYPGHPVPKEETCSSSPTTTLNIVLTSNSPVTVLTSIPGNNSTSTPVTDSNSTTPMTAPNSTTPASNSTTLASNSTSPASNSTTPGSNSTTPASNSTTPASNSTTPASNSTTPASNSTTPASNSTTPASNSTSSMTAPNNTTQISSTTLHISSIEDQCSLLTQMLNCLNMTYFINNTGTMDSTTSHPLYHTLLPVRMPSSTQRICDGDDDNDDDDDSKEYIEDACVALLSNSMWEERFCNINLSYICYDERFMGEIHISNPTETGANLSWSPAPGNITHYRMEVTANQSQTFNTILNETDLSTQLLDLKTGTRYDVQVIPVKCGRDLNPQNISFYTTPFGVHNLSVMTVTNESVELSWDHSGGYDFYSVNVSYMDSARTTPVTVPNRTIPVIAFEIHTSKEKKIVISNLRPAKIYNLTVTAIVNGTKESVPESVSTYTKPSPVLNLTSADKYDTIINASWTKPDENLSGYRVCLNENNIFYNDYSDCIECVNCTNTTAEWINFTGKTPDTKYILCVAALTNNNKVQGEMVQIDAYTRPSKGANLSLSSTNQSITANWNLTEGSKSFIVSIKADGWVGTSNVTDQSSYTFNELQPAKSYTITVITLSEKYELESDPAELSGYTKPSPVLNLTSADDYDRVIYAAWTKPDETISGYRVCLNENNLFCNKCSDCNGCSECKNCTNIKATSEWINFTGKTPDTKYILCVAALTHNNTVQGEMVQIHAYTRPSKVADLSLTSTNQSITANWKLTEGSKKFNVSITSDGMNSTTNVTDQLSYTFNELDAAVKYTVTVITLSENSKLESDPVELSVYTTPSAVYNLKVMKVTNESVELSWNHSGRYDFYSVHVSGVSKLRNTTERTIVISGLTPGKMYNFTVTAIVNGTTKSVPESISTYTKPSRVLNLKSEDDNERLINASWTKSNETLSGYRVCLNENNTFCSKCNDFNDCSECVNCTNTTSTAAWVNFPGKTPGTKYILCVAALTNNNETQGEMVQIDAYTRPSKVANLSLTSTSQSINVSWELIEGYKEFNVSIKADGRIQTFNVTDQSSYFFDKLQAAVNYTITVITLSEKPKLESDPVEQSLHTKPVSPVWATATVLNHTAINVIWGVPKELTGNSTITYKVTAHSHRNTPNESCVTQNNFIFNHLNPGTNYSFNVSVMAGKEASDPKTAYGMTVPNKKKVTFVLMCTSETSLYCSKNTTLAEIKEELEEQFGNNYKDAYWKLKKIDRK